MLFGFIAPKTFNYLVFQSFDFERTWLSLFQNRVVRTKLDIYIFITIYLFSATKFVISWTLQTIIEHYRKDHKRWIFI